MSLALLRRYFFNDRLSLGYPKVIAKFEHLEGTIESIKEKRKERTRKETKEEERTNTTNGKT